MSTSAIATYCTLCGVGCPSVITVDGDRVLALEADRSHPVGGHVCGKGRAAPEIHDHPHRVNHPIRRTRPKDDPDPGWERIAWDEALDLVAERLLAIRTESGPQAVAVGRGTGSGTGLSPTEPWVQRLANAFGTPNYVTNTHLCNWARDGVSHYTFGVYPLPMPDVDRSGCILLWGSNPTSTLLSLGTGVVAARGRGARLVVVDPRRVGLANKADVHLAVRPGTDGALAMAFIHELIEHRWYDEPFVREWTNAPLLVRSDSGRLLRAEDLVSESLPRPNDGAGYVALGARSGAPMAVQPRPGLSAAPLETPALEGSTDVDLLDGRRVRCQTVFALLAEEASRFDPSTAASITGILESTIREAVRLIVEHRPVSHHAWNGIVQHTNASQTGRAIEVFYALLGDWDRPGGNVEPMPLRTGRPAGPPLPSEVAALRLGSDERPLGPASAPPGNIAAYDLYTAILEARPYRIRGLLSFGGNTLLCGGDSLRGREALRELEFFAQAELFHTPTNDLADVVLPAASFLESEMLMITRSGSAQRRRRAVEPLYDRRPDVDIVFELAARLGLGDRFGNGDVVAAYDEALAPAGLTWDGLLEHPHGARVAGPMVYEKYAALVDGGRPRGFATPSGRVELFLDRWAEAGQSPLPRFEEPAESPARTPELAAEYPLVLTNGKKPNYLHSQHRGIVGLRRLQRDPTVEIHPETAERFGVADGAWVAIETPRGRVRAVADVTPRIVPGVVCAFHGWWEACEELGLGRLDPFDEHGANVNLLVHNDVLDPIGGAVPHRSSLCRLVPLAE